MNAENKIFYYTKHGIPVVSLAAYSGTGKTTFMVKLIRELKNRNLRIAAVKHDAHEFEIDKEGKDSWLMTQAGADVTGLISGTKAALMLNEPVPASDFLDKITGVDLILTEGYKTENWPKIMLHRSGTGKPLPLPPEKCLAVISDVKVKGAGVLFGLEDAAAVAEFLMQKINGEKQNIIQKMNAGGSEEERYRVDT